MHPAPIHNTKHLEQTIDTYFDGTQRYSYKHFMDQEESILGTLQDRGFDIKLLQDINTVQ